MAADDQRGDPVHRDLAGLAGWMDQRGLGHGPLTDVVDLAGGTQNVMVRFTRAGTGYVLRRPPRSPRPTSDETMRREARLLGALAGTGVPAPRLIAAEPDPGVLGVAFYLMAPLPGTSITTGIDALAAHPDGRSRLGRELVDGLAALAAVDPVTVGLADFGRPGSFLARQVDRWTAQLESYHRTPGYAGPGTDLAPLTRWLAERRPDDERRGILHGDVHIGNVLFTADGHLTGIVDWELATIGDPLLDLAQLLVTWPRPDRPPFAGFLGADQTGGFTEPAELVARYERATGRDLTHLRWYEALAAYRLGVIIEGSRVRALTGDASEEVGDRLHDAAVALWDGALGSITTPR